MRISLFGSLRIEVAGQPITSVNTNRLQSLLAYLVLHQDTPQPREKLAFTLWPRISRRSGANKLTAIAPQSKARLAGRL